LGEKFSVQCCKQGNKCWGSRTLIALSSFVLTGSKLTDDKANKWASDPGKKKEFCRGLFSLTSVVGCELHDWIYRLTSSDIGCKVCKLSMITDAAELLWAYALKNHRFPGFLWSLVKSTPGLLGLWAHQINLRKPLRAHVRPQDAMDLIGDFASAVAAVPWIGTLQIAASVNWSLIYQFMIEDCPGSRPSDGTKRADRNAGMATYLGEQLALSPFAVAVIGRDIFLDLDNAMKASERYSAGCVKDLQVP
jgi:hypothetical protein